MRKIYFFFILIFCINLANAAWDDNYGYKIPITFSSNGATGRWIHIIDLNSDILGSNNTHFWDHTRSDGFDVKFTDATLSKVYEFQRISWVNDVNATFLFDDSNISDQNTYYVVYGDTNATDDSNSSLIDIIDDFSDGDFTNNPAWVVNNAGFSGWTVTNQELRDDHGGDAQIYTAKAVTNFVQIRLSIDINCTSSTSFVDFWLSSSATQIANNSYVIRQGTSGFQLAKYNAGYTPIISNSTISNCNSGFKKFIVTRNKSGNWQVFYDQNRFGTVIDTTYDDFATLVVYVSSDSRPTLDNIRLWVSSNANEPTYSFGSYSRVDTNSPIVDGDANVIVGFATSSRRGQASLNCSDRSLQLKYIITVNDVNVVDVTDLNSTTYITDVNYIQGNNVVKFTCIDPSGNLATATKNLTSNFINFYFVYDNNGLVLIKGNNDYLNADVNFLKVYSYDLNDYYDMYANNDVNIYYVGGADDGLRFLIGYDDPAYPFITREFDLDVLDVNSVPVCFSPLQPFYQQLMYSSQERDVILKNSHTGCYHVASATKYGYSDSFAVSAYTIPQSYYLYEIDDNETTLLALIDGGNAGTISLDALIIKIDFAQTLIVAGEGATIAKNCSSGVTDCNTWVVYYFNSAQNNSELAFTIYNGVTPILSHTETSSPDNFTLTFDSTTLDFDANILKLVATVTRTDGSTKTFNVYFTPQGQVGFIDPVVAIILSFVIFIGGITFTTIRMVFGWFGMVIALVALAFLSFSVAVWYVTFMQAIMVSLLIYMGLMFGKSQGGAV